MRKCIRKAILVLVALCLLPGPVWGAKNTEPTTVERSTIEQVLQYEIQKNRQAILKKQQADMGIQQPEALANEMKYKFDSSLSAELATGTRHQRNKKINQLMNFQKHMHGLHQNFKAYKENKYKNKNKIKAEVAHHTEQIEKILATDLGKKIARLWNKEAKKHSQYYNKQRAAFIYGELSGQDVKSLDLKQLPTLDKAKVLSEFKDILPPDIINAREPANWNVTIIRQPHDPVLTMIQILVIGLAVYIALAATVAILKLIGPVLVVIVATIIIAALFSAIAYISHRLFVRKGHKAAIEMLKGLVGLTKKTKAIPQPDFDTFSYKVLKLLDWILKKGTTFETFLSRTLDCGGFERVGCNGVFFAHDAVDVFSFKGHA